MKVSLTFDNGPSTEVTPHVLDVLADRSVHATFFVVGETLRKAGCRELAERAKAEGHRIGNHSLTHTVQLGDLDEAGVEREIEQAQALLGDLADSDRLFRPFGGGGVISEHLMGPATADHLCRGRYTCVLWNSVPRDWLEPDAWVDTALADVQAHDWTVVVMHDLPTGAMRHLPRFLDRLDVLGASVVSDFPDSCVPIRRGEPTAALASLPGLARS
jgi:peptidoglycan/xylan/chitin deacetylase (PgdA/CDA1 family)